MLTESFMIQWRIRIDSPRPVRSQELAFEIMLPVSLYEHRVNCLDSRSFKMSKETLGFYVTQDVDELH